MVDVVYQWDSVCDTVPMQAIVLKLCGMIDLAEFLRFKHQQRMDSVANNIEKYLCNILNVKLKAFAE